MPLQKLSPAVEQLISDRIAAAIAAHEANRANEEGSAAGGNHGTKTQGCTYKEFVQCKPTTFSGKEGSVGLVRWFEKLETVFRISNCAEENKVKYATCTLLDNALTWWNAYAQSVGIDNAYAISWEELRKMMTEEYCPRNEVQKLESELWNLKVQGTDLLGYTTRFQELAVLCPNLVNPEYVKVERYIAGLPHQIKGSVTASNPTTLQAAIRMANKLMDQHVQRNMEARAAEGRPGAGKRKRDENKGKSIVQYQETGRPYNPGQGGNKGYVGKHPYCNKCERHHPGQCAVICERCGRKGHIAKNYRVAAPQQTAATPGTCYECGATGHFRRDCPKLKKTNAGTNAAPAKGRNFQIKTEEAREDPELITGTYLLNNHPATVLFDSGADKSFISEEFSSRLNLSPTILNVKYVIEVANGKLIKVAKIFRNCTLKLANHLFRIDLMPVELGSFNLIVGMDWLSKNHAEIVCSDKTLRIPLKNNKMLIIQGEKSTTKTNVLTGLKVQKCLRKWYHATLATAKEKKSESKQLEDIPVVQNFPEVFPEELPGLPPHRQVDFSIELIPGAVPVAKAPY